MNRKELASLLDRENNKPDEMCINWLVVSRQAALEAMRQAYNMAIAEVLKLELKSSEYQKIKNLRIK